ncbi:MAG: hypothetical protein P1U84_05005 [Parvibaculaceae bacterium]|nr:hypothetical protein [Parvibaculaceae bacterium]
MNKHVKVDSEDHWHELRAKHVGGSEIASLFYQWAMPDERIVFRHMFEEAPDGAVLLGCCSSYLTGFRLYHIKAGLLAPDDLDNERVMAGNFLEPAIAEWAKQKWDWNLQKVHRYLTPAEGMGVSRDYEVKEKGFPPVEIKNVDWIIFKDQWTVEDGEIINPPLHITLQLQHQIAATDADHGWVVVCVGGNNLYRCRIERHEPTIDRIKSAVARFWIGVNAGERPHGFEDYDTISDIWSVGEKDKFIDLSNDNQLPELCASYIDLSGRSKQLKDQLDTVKAQIADKMGDHTRAAAQGYKLGWPAVHRTEKLIPEKLQPALDYRMGLSVKEAS